MFNTNIRYLAKRPGERYASALTNKNLSKIILEQYSIIYAGVFSGGIAFTLQMYAQKNIDEAPAAIIYSLEGVFAAVAGWIILNQILDLNNILGCCFILTGVLISQLMPEIKKINYK